MVTHELITSTSNLTPAGILGYAKGIAAAITAALVAVIPLLPEGDWQQWAQIVVAVLGAIAVIAVPNQVKPVTVLPASP